MPFPTSAVAAPRRLAVLALSLALSACSHVASTHGASLLPVQLRVENHSAQQMRVFVRHDGAITRVGELPAATSQTFVIPARLIGSAGEVRLAAEPIAAFTRYVSEPVLLHAGQRLTLTIEHKLDTSSLAVRDQ